MPVWCHAQIRTHTRTHTYTHTHTHAHAHACAHRNRVCLHPLEYPLFEVKMRSGFIDNNSSLLKRTPLSECVCTHLNTLSLLWHRQYACTALSVCLCVCLSMCRFVCVSVCLCVLCVGVSLCQRHTCVNSDHVFLKTQARCSTYINFTHSHTSTHMHTHTHAHHTHTHARIQTCLRT